MFERFRVGHSSHSNWRLALQLALVQTETKIGKPGWCRKPNLGILYLTPDFGPFATDIIDALRARTGIAEWVGSVGTSVVATGVEYTEVPSLAIMLCEFPEDCAHIFSGRQRMPGLQERTASGALKVGWGLIHADPDTVELPDLVQELAERTSKRLLVGGLSSSSTDTFQIANDVISGGLSGVIFSEDVRCHVRYTQGCQPLGMAHEVTRVEGQYVRELDERPALDVLFDDLGVGSLLSGEKDPEKIVSGLPMDRMRSGLLVGTVPCHETNRLKYGDFLVRSLVGIDPKQRVVAIGANLDPGDRLLFCARDMEVMKRELIGMLTQLRADIEEDTEVAEPPTDGSLPIKGAIYVSCHGRGKAYFQETAVEMGLIKEYLGDVPVIGFHGNGELFGDRLHGYTGVLTVFV